MIVVDLGCCPHDGDVSVERLVERYHPEYLYGFDPLLLDEDVTTVEGETTIRLQKKAAWTEKGEALLGIGGRTLLDSTMLFEKKKLGEWKQTVPIRTFDFGDWLGKLGEPAIVKMNIEGAEFPLLEDLHTRELDHLISLLHVSWHDDRMGLDRKSYALRRIKLEEELRCPVAPWTLW